MNLIDTHAHLDQLENVDAALANAHEAGVEAIVAVSMDVKSCLRNLEIKKKTQHPKIFLAMGMHPSEANLAEAEKCLDLIKEHRGELVAVGEIGLDFWYKWVKKDQGKKDEQVLVFRKFVEIAQKFDLPIIIHARGAWRECLDIVKEYQVKKANFHWYSGPIDVLDDILSAGYYVSTSPSVAYSLQSRDAMTHAPMDRILIETDCPVFYQDRNSSSDMGFSAEPMHVERTLDACARLKNVEKGKAADIFYQNTKLFFNI